MNKFLGYISHAWCSATNKMHEKDRKKPFDFKYDSIFLGH